MALSLEFSTHHLSRRCMMSITRAKITSGELTYRQTRSGAMIEFVEVLN